jgi:hypothetical protein
VCSAPVNPVHTPCTAGREQITLSYQERVMIPSKISKFYMDCWIGFTHAKRFLMPIFTHAKSNSNDM